MPFISLWNKEFRIVYPLKEKNDMAFIFILTTDSNSFNPKRNSRNSTWCKTIDKIADLQELTEILSSEGLDFAVENWLNSTSFMLVEL